MVRHQTGNFFQKLLGNSILFLICDKAVNVTQLLKKIKGCREQSESSEATSVKPRLTTVPSLNVTC